MSTNEDTSARLDAIEARQEEQATSINEQATSIEELRQMTARLQQLGFQLVEAARVQQEALRVFQANAEEDRAAIRQILEYLFGQQRNGNGGQGNP